MTSPNTPFIFTVIVFRTLPAGRDCVTHHVAAFTSSEAEARIKARDIGHLQPGEAFITTDQHALDHGNGMQFYTNTMRHEQNVSDEELRQWKRHSLIAQDADGQTYPAAFRPIVAA